MHDSDSSQNSDNDASEIVGCRIHSGSNFDPNVDPGLHGNDYYQDPQRTYRHLYRTQGPVAQTHVLSGVPAWIVLGHQELEEVYSSNLSNGGAFTRDNWGWNAIKEGIIPENWPHLAQFLYSPGVRWADGENYIKLRSIMEDNFNEIDSKRIQKHAKKMSRSLIDNFISDGHTDLTVYSYELSVLIVLKLLGISEQNSGTLALAARILVSDDERAYMGDEILRRTLADTIKQKRENPGTDIISQMVKGCDPLNDDEIIAYLWCSMISGIEATNALLGNTLFELLDSDSGGWADITIYEAIYRTLWNNPPAHTVVGRWATRDTSLGGKSIRKGDLLLLCTSFADQLRLESEEVDSSKELPKYAWSGGVHICPAKGYASLIVHSAIQELREAVPSMRLNMEKSQIQWKPSHTVRALASLQVEFLASKPRYNAKMISSGEESPIARKRKDITNRLKKRFGA